MKRFTLCITVFLMMLWFSGNSVHAKTPNTLQVISAIADMTDPDNPIIEIYALNFGDGPQVKLGDELLKINSVLDQYIFADLPVDIEPGTHRLSVARSGFDFSHPEKADSLDVTISDAESGESREPSGALERGNIYEIHETDRIYEHDAVNPIIIQCSCRDENDIALNGGYEIRIRPYYPDPELTILKSNMYYSDNTNDYYQLVVKNYIAFGRVDSKLIQIDAYLRCIEIPND